jgi:hypothetical protein
MLVMLAMLFALTVTAGRGHFAVRGTQISLRRAFRMKGGRRDQLLQVRGFARRTLRSWRRRSEQILKLVLACLASELVDWHACSVAPLRGLTVQIFREERQDFGLKPLLDAIALVNLERVN